MSAFRGHAGAMMRGLGYQRELLANHPKEPHWYLWSLTVEPDMQGRGVGSALTADGLARADAQRCGAYLETQNLENLAFYERFGFAPRGAVQPAPEAPPLYCLWRPSR
jgi:ribosomal protein S18 acetylase RimI-like enzyme